VNSGNVTVVGNVGFFAFYRNKDDCTGLRTSLNFTPNVCFNNAGDGGAQYLISKVGSNSIALTVGALFWISTVMTIAFVA
jgi:hypothetical protein